MKSLIKVPQRGFFIKEFVWMNQKTISCHCYSTSEMKNSFFKILSVAAMQKWFIQCTLPGLMRLMVINHLPGGYGSVPLMPPEENAQ